MNHPARDEIGPAKKNYTSAELTGEGKGITECAFVPRK